MKAAAASRLRSASISLTWRLPGEALAAICTCAEICVEERTRTLLTVMPSDGVNTTLNERATKFAPVNVSVTVEPAAACVGAKPESDGGMACAWAIAPNARQNTHNSGSRHPGLRTREGASLRFVISLNARYL